jgi:hypothetical protein
VDERSLRAVLRRFRRPPPEPALSLAPRSAYEAVTRQQVEDLRQELHELRTRVNALLFGIAATFLAVVVDVVMRR